MFGPFSTNFSRLSFSKIATPKRRRRKKRKSQKDSQQTLPMESLLHLEVEGSKRRLTVLLLPSTMRTFFQRSDVELLKNKRMMLLSSDGRQIFEAGRIARKLCSMMSIASNLK